LFYQELMAMHVRPQLIIKSKTETLETMIKREPQNLEIRNHILPINQYQHDPELEQETIDNYFKLTWIPKPQDWEIQKYNIPTEITLWDKLESMSQRERELESLERKQQAEESKAAKKGGVKSETKMPRKRLPVQSPSMMFASASGATGTPPKAKKVKR
jgi:hypothetical protein